jgi:hypothetical protein
MSDNKIRSCSREEDFKKVYGRCPTKEELEAFVEYLKLVRQ